MTGRLLSERGVALVAVLMLMLVMSGLVTGLVVSGRTEVSMSTNDVAYAATRAAAEAGLNHGVVLALGGTSVPTLFLGPDGAVNTATPSATVNVDNGSLAHLIGGAGPWAVEASDARYTYAVRLMDDDDPLLFTVPLTAAELTSMGENGSGLLDTNGRYVIRASGFGPDGLRVNVETMLSPDVTSPAVVMNGNLTMSGTAKILGTAGSVHVNGNLTISATGVVVNKNATASLTYTKPTNWTPGGTGAGGASTIAVPAIDAASYLTEADLILTSTGLILNRATGATVCTASSNKSACKGSYGWTFTSASAGWNMNNASGVAATYYVQGPATLSGSPGSVATPLRMSVIATGSITVSGSPKISPEAASGLLFVTNGDLRITGSLNQQAPEGRILVREQLQISGSATLKAQILVANAATISTVVTANTISGSANLTYNASLSSQSYAAGGWREGQ